MAKALIVVESPTKARTIERYVGKDMEVKASVGHIKDLPEKRLGVAIEDDFRPELERIKGKEKLIREIKAAAKKADKVYLAPDPDREGEAIAWHIAEEIDSKGKEIYRALFNDLSRETIIKSLKENRGLDKRKYEAQLARRIMDRLVGYQISPVLWQKVRKGLSAGRVQSVALRLICERQKEIESFESKEYWTINAILKKEGSAPFEARLLRFHGKKAEVSTREEAEAIRSEAIKETFTVSRVEKKEQIKKAFPPFITSTLQQEAFKRFRFPAKKTMVLAQQLYEGVELGKEGSVGLITYMRTDSFRISSPAIDSVRSYIEGRFGNRYLPQEPNLFKSRKAAQEAHEAIRPTDLSKDPEAIKEYLNADQYRLYKLVWERFIASQMAPARFDRTSVDITAGPYLFRASGSIMKFPGFMAVFEVEPQKKEEQERSLPQLVKGDLLKLLDILMKQHFTQPPSPYTEASLIKALEEKGIGRPSTYATILSTIRKKEYVEVKDRCFYPTELGMLVTELLVKSFPEILDVEFTAKMEDRLDRIEEGQTSRVNTLRDFYQSFSKDYRDAIRDMKDLRRKGILTEINCDLCGKKMVIKVGKKGPFLSCSGFPECKNSRAYTRDEKGQIVVEPAHGSEERCERCGRLMVLKEGPYGDFLGCSGYPQCRNTRPMDSSKDSMEQEPEASQKRCPICESPMIAKEGRYGKFLACSRYPECKGSRPLEVKVACPLEGCGGTLMQRRSARGRKFYGCSNYPSCRYALWEKPIERSCPSCGYPILVEKRIKGGLILACASKECDYKSDFT